uniref:Putative secreted protein n=1 Tax=Xenopsylla cheopis TaxID=163159 RepID=A0A6M2E049_XENCH
MVDAAKLHIPVRSVSQLFCAMLISLCQCVWYPLVHLLNLANLRKVSQYRCMVNFHPDSKFPRGYGWIRFH